MENTYWMKADAYQKYEVYIPVIKEEDLKSTLSKYEWSKEYRSVVYGKN